MINSKTNNSNIGYVFVCYRSRLYSSGWSLAASRYVDISKGGL